MPARHRIRSASDDFRVNAEASSLVGPHGVIQFESQCTVGRCTSGRLTEAWTGAVALFPRELLRDPTGDGLKADAVAVHQDVMTDDPVVRERYLATLARAHASHGVRHRAVMGRGLSEVSLAAPAATDVIRSAA